MAENPGLASGVSGRDQPQLLQHGLHILAGRDPLADRDGEVAVGAAPVAEGDVEINMHRVKLMNDFRNPQFALRTSGEPKHHPRPLLHHSPHFQFCQRRQHGTRVLRGGGYEHVDVLRLRQ